MKKINKNLARLVEFTLQKQNPKKKIPISLLKKGKISFMYLQVKFVFG
jgi:hypothetical protein